MSEVLRGACTDLVILAFLAHCRKISCLAKRGGGGGSGGTGGSGRRW